MYITSSNPEKHLLDSADFIEQLLKHLLRSKEVLERAKELGLRGDDFLSSSEYGIQSYKIIADLALSIGTGPISQDLLGIHIRSYIEAGKIHDAIQEQIIDLFVGLYHGELNPEYFANEFKNFIKRRRQERAKLEHSDDADELAQALTKIAVDLSADEAYAKASIVNPFQQIIKKSIYQMVGTGLRRLDVSLGGGIGYGEFGLIIGFSGSGKTLMSTLMSKNAAIAGKKSAYFSFEESHEDLANRYYSQVYKIPYGELRSGAGYSELEEKFNNEYDADYRRLLIENLRLFAMKGSGHMKPSAILELLIRNYEETGFIPDVVYVDQLQFLEPEKRFKQDQSWGIEKRIAEDFDSVSHQKIGDRLVAWWLNHQAKGKVKLRFTRDDIDGFKGIIHKPETVIGIGRENERSDDFLIFSLKSRHSKGFELPYKGVLEYMSLEDPPEQSAAPVATGSYNVPPRETSVGHDPETLAKLQNGIATRITNERSIPQPSIPEGQPLVCQP